MPIYLDEEMIGSDPDCIGFPHVLVCMAIVAQTNTALHGIHVTRAGRDTETAVRFFADYLSRHDAGRGQVRRLYGSADFKTRYGNVDSERAWAVEMRTIAQILGVDGSVCGFDASVINPLHGTYVEYQAVPGQNRCRIFFKRNEKMDYTHEKNTAGIAKVTQPFFGMPDSLEPLIPGSLNEQFKGNVPTTATIRPGHTLTKLKAKQLKDVWDILLPELNDNQLKYVV